MKPEKTGFISCLSEIAHKICHTSPAYALTGYTAQGGTFPKAILDLSSPHGKHPLQHADIYVLLSRLKKLKGLMILRPFDIGVLRTTPGNALQEEIKRLKLASEPKP